MAEKDTIFKGKVKDRAIFDFPELYRFCYSWLVEGDYFVVEKVYTEKVKPDGKEIEIEWEAERKISDYFKFVIKANWRILGLKEVEVEKNNEKITMNKGDVEIKVSAILVKDYESRWEDNAFSKFLRGVYDRYIIRGRIDQYEGKIFGEADEFLAQIKAFLALEGKH